MERARPPRSSDDSGSVIETIEPLPNSVPLSVLLNTVRSPGVVRADVEALLKGLARPPAENEPPRARADLLLSIIESQDVSDMQGSDGRTVREVAVQALLDLGYPYALEVPPEALRRRRAPTEKITNKKKSSVPGFIAMLAGFIAQGALCIPLLFFITNSFTTYVSQGLFALLLLLTPTLLAVLGSLMKWRGLQKIGLVMMTIMGLLWSIAFIIILFKANHPLTEPFTYVSLVSAAGFLSGAYLTRESDLLDDDETPNPDPTS